MFPGIKVVQTIVKELSEVLLLRVLGEDVVQVCVIACIDRHNLIQARPVKACFVLGADKPIES